MPRVVDYSRARGKFGTTSPPPLCVYLSFFHNPSGSYERRTDFSVCAKTSVNLKRFPAKLFCIEFYHVQDALLYISRRNLVHSLYALKDYVMKFLFLLAIDYLMFVGLVSQPSVECEVKVSLILIQTSFVFLWKLCLKNVSQHKNNMIYKIKREGLCKNKINHRFVSTHNCKMGSLVMCFAHVLV